MRLTVEQRRKIIIDAAVAAANEHGLFSFTRKNVSDFCTLPCAVDTVKQRFPAHNELREIVAKDPRASEAVRAAAEAVGMETAPKMPGQ